MAAALIERAWRNTAPETVEHELATMWRELAGRGAIARAVMANLLVFRLHDRRRDPSRTSQPTREEDAPLEAVLALHPSRAIVIEHDRGEHEAAPPIGAAVGICIFGPPSAAYGVERVFVRSASAEASLASIARRFLRGDVPTSLWWTEDVSRSAPLPALVQLARQLVYDSRQWRNVEEGIRRLAPIAASGRTDLADLNWRRLAPVRRVLASLGRERLSSEVRIIYKPAEQAIAWLLSGWMSRHAAWPAVTAADPSKDDTLVRVEIGTGESQIALVMDAHHVVLTQSGIAASTIPIPVEDEAHAVAAELRALSYDSELRQALMAIAPR